MAKEHLNIAIAQMTSSSDVEVNKQAVLEKLDSIASDIDLVFFPENTLSITIAKTDKIKPLELTDPFFKLLKERCTNLGIEIQICTPVIKEGKVYNSSFWISKKGIQDIYDKNHLFKVNLPNQKIDEGKTFTPGDEYATHTFQGWKFGSSICYDLRFSYVYHYYATQSMDVITIPSAFTVKTGRDHWETLQRARAIETQSYIISAAQTGIHVCPTTGEERRSYGHSLVIDPWGNVLLDAGVEDGLYYCQIFKESLRKTKQILPMNRKP